MKIFAALFALLSGVYLLSIGILPDPILFVDEGIAVMVLVQSLAVLGLDLRRYIPGMRKWANLSGRADRGKSEG